MISGGVVTTFREDAGANVTHVVELEDPSDQESKTCKRFAFATPVPLAPSSRVTLNLSVGWGAQNALLDLGGVTFELDRA